MKLGLISKVKTIFESGGYEVGIFTGCFDVAARKERTILAKVLSNIDSFLFEHSESLKTVSGYLDANPVLIGERTRKEKLERGVVYERFGIPAFNTETLFDIVHRNVFPKVFRDRGGFYTEIDPQLLREARKRKGFTQQELADVLGVSKKTVYQHERKKCRMILELASKLERILDAKVSSPEIFKTFHKEKGPETSMERFVEKYLRRMGFATGFVRHSPFDAVVKSEFMIFSEIEERPSRLKYRLKSFTNFLELMEKPGVVISEKRIETDVPVIERKRLGKMTGDELLELITG
ncbi:MAG: helix-turn-helix domain-containing protein [Candidatus Micrarchaeota archaeon]|nr:helix-turn-helix domain-containing protein [Candidatus Micrarchaeota archaeon]